MRLRVAAIAIASMLGCADAGAPVQRRAVPIIGGAPDPSHDAVVALVRADGVQCSGVALTRRVVLTAGHCLTGIDPTTIEVRVGADDAAPIARATVARGERYPTAAGTADDYPGGVDLGALEVSTELPLTPMPIADLAGDPRGRAATVIGFGRSSPFDPASNTRRLAVTLAVERACSRFLQMGGADANACAGDSGGAVLIDGGLVALVSAGLDGCSTLTTFTRLAPHRAWIDRVAAGTFGAPCPECLSPDPACDAPVPGSDAAVTDGASDADVTTTGAAMGGGCVTTRAAGGSFAPLALALLTARAARARSARGRRRARRARPSRRR